MQRVLITGAAGFAAQHLAAELRTHGIEPVGLDLAAGPAGMPWVRGSIEDGHVLQSALASFSPEGVVHLAAISSVPKAESDPAKTLRINVEGTLRLLDAVRQVRPLTRVLLVSTAQVYGSVAGAAPISEEAPLQPDSIYALSKVLAEQVARYYIDRYGLRILVARPVNHIGPGQSPDFAVASFARQIAAIAAGRLEPVLRTGNLESVRDFTDVRDVVRGYRLLLLKGIDGGVYNLAAGRLCTLREVLQRLCALAGVSPRIETDPTRYRPTDRGPLLDTRRIRQDTGWKAEIPLEQTLQDILEASAREADSVGDQAGHR